MRNKRPFLFGAALAVGLLLILWGAVVYQFGSVENSFRYIQGYNYVVYPNTIEVGEGPKGEKRMTSVRVRNLSFSPIRIVGAVTTCNCIYPSEMPLMIPPRCAKDLPLAVYLESSTGDVEQMATLLIDDGQMQRAPVLIVGKCSTQRKSTK